MMVLSVVEALPLQDLCGNATVALFIQLLATKEKQVKGFFSVKRRKEIAIVHAYEVY